MLDNVFLRQVDSAGDLYLDLFDDSLQVPQPKVREMLYAGLEKAQADLESFALETEDRVAKQIFSDYAGQLKDLMEKLKPHLLH